jgi:hypothetical protein
MCNAGVLVLPLQPPQTPTFAGSACRIAGGPRAATFGGHGSEQMLNIIRAYKELWLEVFGC